MSQQNVNKVRDFIEAYNRRDFDAAVKDFHRLSSHILMDAGELGSRLLARKRRSDRHDHRPAVDGYPVHHPQPDNGAAEVGIFDVADPERSRVIRVAASCDHLVSDPDLPEQLLDAAPVADVRAAVRAGRVRRGRWRRRRRSAAERGAAR